MPPITNYREQPYNADEQQCWPSEADTPLQPGIMRVLYTNGVPTMCNYLCPCGCGMECPTFFPVKGGRQRTPQRHLWDFSKGPNGPTLSPSVRHTSGCKWHYNITDGKVIVHGDSGK